MKLPWQLAYWTLIQRLVMAVAMLMMSNMPLAAAQGTTPLDSETFRAAYQGNAEALRDLLQKGANPEAVSNTGMPVIAIVERYLNRMVDNGYRHHKVRRPL